MVQATESIITRIKGILAKRDSLQELISKASTQEEVLHLQNEYEVAAYKALQLLKQYQLTEANIKGFDFSPKNINISIFEPEKYGIKIDASIPLLAWQKSLSAMICFNMNVRIIVAKNNIISIVGYEEDRIVAIEMLGYLWKSLEDNSNQSWNIHEKLSTKDITGLPVDSLSSFLAYGSLPSRSMPTETIYKFNFCLGAITRIAERLINTTFEARLASGDKALAVIFENKKLSNIDSLIEELSKKLQNDTGKALVKASHTVIDEYNNMPYNGEAFYQGIVHGNSVDLSNKKKLGE